MVTEVVETTVDMPIPLDRIWDALNDPATYARMFRGIGDCRPVVSAGERLDLEFRIGTLRTGVRRVEVRLIPGRPYRDLELYCPTLGSLASVRLGARPECTHVAVTVFAPGRVHPMVPELPNSAVSEWIRAGLQRVAEYCTGARTAVVKDGTGAPVRRQVVVARQMLSSGVVQAHRLDHGVRQLAGLAKWGLSLAGGYATASGCTPSRACLIDDRAHRTFAELHKRTNAQARALLALGIDHHHTVGLLSRNHIATVEAMVAAGKAGVDLILLNAGLSGRQLEEIAQRDRISVLLLDAELGHLVRYLHPGIQRFTIDGDPPTPERTTLEELSALSPGTCRRPARPGRLIVLTFGTSGTPKGARRPHPAGLDPVAAVLSRIPLRMHETMLIASPLFHTWGLGILQLSTALRATVVLQRRFDAEACLRAVAEHRVRTLVLVPTLLQRILELPPHVRARYDTSSLEIVACGGAPLPGGTALHFMNAFGDVLYNVYGSTEVSWATIATPQDLRESPETVGRPPAGTTVAVLGPNMLPVPVGAVGRIFVGNPMLFDGYVNAAPPDEVGGLLDTGDLGYLDVSHRLFVAGRGDELVISGGEKFFPRPVEEALEHLPQVREAAVVGVPDADFGQRMAAFVVKTEGSGLDAQMVRDYIRNRLGRFAVPRDVSFIPALPRGETGKILKRLLIMPNSGASQAM
ncbi:AMP-binding protein [Nocardia macrotermitis]|uniref:2-succinylbenzoate--CoA ligase n=1 Tax=Nocardia macrotermitis TaxID=2585198 RepID=A0A7K0CUF4_9NOCA|nr:AMP-binding protein [Nocardia macrotermitis]MQY17101.1 2-succinylbenzoate--CoA ligase [Nocardia macrotermitis]